MRGSSGATTPTAAVDGGAGAAGDDGASGGCEGATSLRGDRLPARAPVEPVGRLGAARGLGLPFGQADAAMLAGLAAAVGAAAFRPAPGRALMVVGAADDAALVAAARRLGFVVDAGRSAAGDRRLLGRAGLRLGAAADAGAGRRGRRPEIADGVDGCTSRAAASAARSRRGRR